MTPGETARRALAAAANTVEGVKATPYFRQSTNPGDAFVRLDTAGADDTGFGYMLTWQVCVILHQDLAAAEKQTDRLLPPLLAALDAEGHVTGAQPVQLALDGPTVPALIVSVILGQEK